MNDKIYVIRATASSDENKRVDGLIEKAWKYFGAVAFQFRANDHESIGTDSIRESILKWEPAEIWLCGSDAPESFKETLIIIGNIQTAGYLTVVDLTHPTNPAAKAVKESALRIADQSKFLR